MILTELRLANFCIYKGDHAFDLSPTTVRGKNRPVVLFGGLNGGGKTTILNAVQLVLYGKRASCAKRAELGYEQFLRGCINHQVDTQAGAGITLSFLYASEGEESLYEIQRIWAETSGGALRERMYVYRDGEEDQWMADNWSQLVDDIVPLGVAQLCFFDAEKIRFLAEDDSSNEALGEAIKSLLGLDLAERLVTDASVLEGRLARKITKSDELSSLTELEGQWRAQKSVVSALKQDRAGVIPELERSEEIVRKTESHFARIGGRHWEQREERQRERGKLKQQLDTNSEALVQLSAGALPLTLISGILQSAAIQAAGERTTTDADGLRRLLQERDESVLKLIRNLGVEEPVLESVTRHLGTDRDSRCAAENQECWLELPDVSQRRLADLLSGGLDAVATECRTALEERRIVIGELETVERSLAAAPKEDVIREVADALKLAVAESTGVRQKLSRIEDELRPAEVALEQLEQQVSKLRHRCVDEQLEHDENARICALVQRTQQTMREFLRRSTAQKISRLSDLVTTSFRYLLRKEKLIDRVEISAEDFSITLIDQSGNELPKDRLSEGEKQIFAISVLWGLSQASARPLPAIIDTPMGRLDSEHRRQLVDRYFPHASHQVIILSTDTEVEADYYEKLKPSLARAYHLRYDEAERATYAEEGYFWESLQTEDAR